MDTPNSIRRARPLLGTFVEIAASGPGGRALEEAVEGAFAAVAQVHRLMSFHDAASDVSRLNREASAGATAVHAWTYQVLQAAAAMHRQSAGIFDITIAPVLQARGLLPGGDGIAAPSMERAGAADAIELLADGQVRYRHPGVRIDLGGIAKGFAVDRAVAVLRAHAVEAGLVNACGDLAVFGAKPELVHLRHPNDARRPLFQVELDNAALASSGRLIDPFRSADAGECAIVDPRAADRQVHAVTGATVRAPSCMIADALTKVIMIGGAQAEQLLSRYQASALFVLESGDVWITPDWQSAVRFAA
jgi:thiamine biosynthesis lipoprotein